MKPVGRQLLRFGIVGLGAGATHVGTVLLCVELGLLDALWANDLAFLVAFQVSYFGHQRWTFEADTDHKRQLPRFGATALMGAGLNRAIMYTCYQHLGLTYLVGLGAVVVSVPVLTFALNRLWVFADDP